MRYYQKVIDAPATGKQKDREVKVQNRARANLEAIRLFELSDPRKVPDGAYRAASLGYEGPVEVEVKVAGGRIESVQVTDHKEKQYYSALTDVPQQIIAKQDTAKPGVSATSKKAGGRSTARRNVKKRAPRATATLEDSRTTPSRKSTRRSANRQKSATPKQRTVQLASRSPKRRATRARAARGGR